MKNWIRDKKVFFITALTILVLDFISKMIVLNYFSVGETLSIIDGFFNFTLVMNPGAAFGMFANLPDSQRRPLLWLVTVLAMGFVFYLLKNDAKDDAIAEFALSCILGGALGNIIDRVRYDAVVDFIDIFYKQYHWPAFNIADSAICIGVTLLFFRFSFVKPKA